MLLSISMTLRMSVYACHQTDLAANLDQELSQSDSTPVSLELLLSDEVAAELELFSTCARNQKLDVITCEFIF